MCKAQYPQCGNTLVGRAWSADGDTGKPVPFLTADCRRTPDKSDIARVTDWLTVRTGSAGVRVVMTATRGRILRKNGGARST